MYLVEGLKLICKMLEFYVDIHADPLTFKERRASARFVLRSYVHTSVYHAIAINCYLPLPLPVYVRM